MGCATPASILVEVDAPDLPAGTLDQLRFQVDGPGGRMADTTLDLPPSWPQTLAVRPGGAGSSAEVTIRVTGLKAGAARIRRVVTARFGSGEVRVRVTLSPACLDHLCADPFTDCVADSCADTSDGGVDAGEDGGVDAGFDAGPIDSGFDAGPVDSGMDTGMACDGSGFEVCNGMDDDCDGIVDDGLPCPGALVISEVRTGSTASGTDEFVELYNRRDFAISLDGVALEYLTATSTSWSARVSYAAADIIPAHGFFLATSGGYTGSVTADASWTRGFANAGGHVRIQFRGTELDRFGWGTAAMPEGTAFPKSTDNAGSYERKANAASTPLSMQSGADVNAGNGEDTDDNGADFVRRATADPQNRMSPIEAP